MLTTPQEHQSQELRIPRAGTDNEWRHPWPDDLQAVWTALCTADPSLRELGWEPVVADLTQVRALQPVVSLDDPRCEGLDRTASFGRLAEICVPAYPLAVPSTSFDERVSSWVLRGQTSNIQVTGRFSGPVEGAAEGSNGFGFIVSAQPSRLEIVVVDGIPVLRDGYHRAVGLLECGITVVPALLAPAGIERDRRRRVRAGYRDRRTRSTADRLPRRSREWCSVDHEDRARADPPSARRRAPPLICMAYHPVT